VAYERFQNQKEFFRQHLRLLGVIGATTLWRGDRRVALCGCWARYLQLLCENSMKGASVGLLEFLLVPRAEGAWGPGQPSLLEVQPRFEATRPATV
jgi:hypothetical protein